MRFLRFGFSLLLIACASNPTASSMPDLASSPDLAMAPTATVAGIVDDPSAASGPLAGVTVCLHPAGSPCATTDAQGIYELNQFSVPDEFALLFEKSGFVSDIFPFPQIWDETESVNVGLVSLSLYAAWETTAGKTHDASKGGILVNLVNKSQSSRVLGATIALDPVQGDGPYYYDGGGAAATLVQSAANGVNLFLNVPVGTVGVVVTPPAGKTCYRVHGWSSPQANAVKVPVAANIVTSVVMSCYLGLLIATGSRPR